MNPDLTTLVFASIASLSPMHEGSVVHHHRSDAGCWDHFHRVPDHALWPYVIRYKGYWEGSYFGPPRRDIPTPAALLVIDFGQRTEWRPAAAENDEWRTISGPYAIGLTEAPVLRRVEAGWTGIVVDLTPRGANHLFRVPMSELANRYTALNELLGREAVLLQSRLAETESWNDRFDLVEAFILSRLCIAKLPSPEVEWAWAHLARTGGVARVSDLATMVGVSPKTLIRRFREEIGLPPKRIARLLRLDRALHLLSSTDLPWSWIVGECSYYDQAHLINELRQYTGQRPSEVRISSRSDLRPSELPLGVLSSREYLKYGRDWRRTDHG